MKIKLNPVYLLLLFFISLVMGQQHPVDALKENVRTAEERISQQEARRDQQRFRIAQNYINTNRHELAIPILEDLHSRYPSNMTYYEWLFRTYLTLSEISKADSLVSLMQTRDPQNVNFRIDQATIYFQKDQRKRALELWNRILEENPSNINIHTQVANAMLSNRLMDEAIAVYERAIQNIPNSQNLYLNIANLYRSRLMYVKATDYYLKYLEIQPGQRSYIFNQILAMQIEPEQRANFFRVLEERIAEDKQSREITLLLGQLYQRYSQYEKALETFLKLEEDKNNDVRLLDFARSAEQDSAYAVALKAYRYVVKNYPESSRLINAYSGAISTLFHMAVMHSQQQFADQAFRLIDSVNTRFSGHPELSRLKYLKGVFYLDYFFDVDAAMNIFTEILNSPGLAPARRNETLLKLGECHILKGELDKAINIFSQAKGSLYEAHAALSTARVYYFKKDWEKSSQTLEELVGRLGANADVINDALALKMKISFSQSVPFILGSFAEAELLEFQQKKSEALKKFAEITRRDSVPPVLKSQAYLQAVELSLELDEPLQGAELCKNAIADAQIQPYADKHLFLLAGILKNSLNRPEEAADVYLEILQSYPNSLLADRARDELRQMKEIKGVEFP